MDRVEGASSSSSSSREARPREGVEALLPEQAHTLGVVLVASRACHAAPPASLGLRLPRRFLCLKRISTLIRP